MLRAKRARIVLNARKLLLNGAWQTRKKELVLVFDPVKIVTWVAGQIRLNFVANAACQTRQIFVRMPVKPVK